MKNIIILSTLAAVMAMIVGCTTPCNSNACVEKPAPCHTDLKGER